MPEAQLPAARAAATDPPRKCFPLVETSLVWAPAERRRKQLPNSKSRRGLVPARRRPPGSCRYRLTPRSPGACRKRRLSTATRWGGGNRARRTKATRLPGPASRRTRSRPAVAKGRLAPFGGRGSLERACDRRSARQKLAQVMEGRIVLAYFWAMLRLAHAWRDQPWKRLSEPRAMRQETDTCSAVPARCLAPCASRQRNRPATARRGCRGVLREGVNGVRLASALRFVFGMLTGPYRGLLGDLRARRRGPPPEDPAAWLPRGTDGQRFRDPSLPQDP